MIHWCILNYQSLGWTIVINIFTLPPRMFCLPLNRCYKHSPNKIDVPNPNIYLNRIYLSGMWFGVAPTMDTQKEKMLVQEKNIKSYIYILCSKYNNHSKLNSQHHGGSYMIVWKAQESPLWQRISYSYELHKLWGNSLQLWFGLARHLQLRW